MKTIIWAHRGASHYAPENTMESFELAKKQGARGIELDVQLTSDREIVVFHDDTLERVTDARGAVASRTMAELKKTYVTVNPEIYPNAEIPSLREVYDFIRSTDMLINVELKENVMSDSIFIEKIAALEKEYNLAERIIYSSFNHYSLMALRRMLPSAKIGLLYFAALHEPWNYAKSLRADYIHPHWTFCNISEEAQIYHKHKMGINIWTIDDPEIMKTAFHHEVDGLITNRPDLAVQIQAQNT